MIKKTVNILGTDYEIRIDPDDPMFKYDIDPIDGYCDETTKTIVVQEFVPDDRSKSDLRHFQKQVIRHELIHAFLFESGLAECSSWAKNEELVDFFAIQIPKMILAMEQAEVL